MRLIDGSHLKKWILQRWEKAYPHEDLPTREVLEQIDREISYKMIDIDPQPKWIPCSERFPKTEVLCCDKYGEMIIAYVYADKTSDTGFSAESDTQCMYNCVAWQPLPEPYKEG